MAMVNDALGMKNAIICLFSFVLYDKLENNFLLYVYLYLYIYSKYIYIMSMYKRFVLDIYYCEHSIYTLLQLFHFETKVNVLRTIG